MGNFSLISQDRTLGCYSVYVVKLFPIITSYSFGLHLIYFAFLVNLFECRCNFSLVLKEEHPTKSWILINYHKTIKVSSHTCIICWSKYFHLYKFLYSWCWHWGIVWQLRYLSSFIVTKSLWCGGNTLVFKWEGCGFDSWSVLHCHSFPPFSTICSHTLFLFCPLPLDVDMKVLIGLVFASYPMAWHVL